MKIDLRSGQKGGDADVHGQAAPDPGDHLAFNHTITLLAGPADLIPDLQIVGFVFGKDDDPFVIFSAFQIDIYLIPLLYRHVFLAGAKLGYRHLSFRFITHVDGHKLFPYFNHPSLDDLPFRELTETLFVDFTQIFFWLFFISFLVVKLFFFLH